MRACATTLESELSADELTCLTELLKNKNNFTRKHLEIGTAAGGTLWRMMECYDNASRPPFVVIDPMTYFENQVDLVRKNLADHNINPGTVDFRTSKSHEALATSEKNSEEFDFIFIDGNHKFRYVMRDLCWARRLRAGGILCLHDYDSNCPGVVLAADRFLRANKNYEVTDQVGRLLVIRKTAESDGSEVSIFDLIYSQVRTPFMQLRKSIEKRIG